MALPITLPVIPTDMQTVGQQIQSLHDTPLRFMANGMLTTISLIAKVGGAAFWAAQGTNGGALVAEFAAYLAFLQAHGPQYVTAAMTAATANLVVGTDGTVTISTPS